VRRPGSIHLPRLTFRLYSRNPRLRGASGIFWIQAGGGHKGSTKVFWGNNECFGWCWITGFYLVGGRDEAIAPADHSLQVLRFVGIIRQSAANLADGGIDSLFDGAAITLRLSHPPTETAPCRMRRSASVKGVYSRENSWDRLLVRLGDRIRKLRKKRGWTQVEMAERVGIDRSFLADVERGNS